MLNDVQSQNSNVNVEQETYHLTVNKETSKRKTKQKQ